MKVALISDIHGNLLALERVLEDLERERPDRVLCLGDVAAFGPEPRETIERLRGLDYPTVMGNVDDALLRGRDEDANADEHRRRIGDTIRWDVGQLSSEDLDYLGGFTPTLEADLDGDRLLCFHGSPRSFDDVIVATTAEDDLNGMFPYRAAEVMAGGHTHAQFVRRYREGLLLNPGSVGLNPAGAEYALVGSCDGRLTVELRHIDLPRETIARSLLERGVPHAEWWADYWREN